MRQGRALSNEVRNRNGMRPKEGEQTRPEAGRRRTGAVEEQAEAAEDPQADPVLLVVEEWRI
jgi:hypothetical protein